MHDLGHEVLRPAGRAVLMSALKTRHHLEQKRHIGLMGEETSFYKADVTKKKFTI